MSTTNMCGTTILGFWKLSEEECKELKNKGIRFRKDDHFSPYFAIKWFQFIALIIPLKSYIVLDEVDPKSWGSPAIGGSSITYQYIEIPLKWRQVLHHYIAEVGIVLIFFLFLYLKG
jgi:hypothetical protein